jgi:hypothetical protein
VQVRRESGFSPATVEELDQFGNCQAIWRLDDGYFAASDPRRDGQAVGSRLAPLWSAVVDEVTKSGFPLDETDSVHPPETRR